MVLGTTVGKQCCNLNSIDLCGVAGLLRRGFKLGVGSVFSADITCCHCALSFKCAYERCKSVLSSKRVKLVTV